MNNELEICRNDDTWTKAQVDCTEQLQNAIQDIRMDKDKNNGQNRDAIANNEKRLDLPKVIPLNFRVLDTDDTFELASGHKVVGSKGNYRITDNDGNSVKIASGKLTVTGNILGDQVDQTGLRTIKFQNGSSIIYAPVGRVTITGSKGETSSLRLDTGFPRNNGMFQDLRRGGR